MAEIGSAFVSILPSARGFGSKLESEVSGDVNGVGKRLGSGFGKLFAVSAGLVAAAGIGNFLKGSIDEAREAQKVGALTAQVIKTTGGVANVTAKQVGDLATAISLKSGVDDEAIQTGANLLLTFKNVRNEAGKGSDVFNRATQAAVDLSASGFGSVDSASKQLGKALNDPIKGISALSRSGVTFTAQQQEQIKALVAGGDALSAQKIILKEVESQVGGAAAATATYGDKASVAFGNIKEQVGTALLPILDRVLKAFVDATPAISSFISKIGPAFAKVQAVVGPVLSAFVKSDLGKAIGKAAGPILAVGAAILVLTNPIGLAVSVIAALTAGFLAAYRNSEPFRALLAQIGAVMTTQVVPALQSFVQSIITNVVPVVQQFAQVFVSTILPAVSSFVSYVISAVVPVFVKIVNIISTQVIPIVASFASFVVGTLIPAVVQIAQSVGSKLKPVFEQLVSTFRTQVLPAIQSLLAKFKEYQPTIQAVIAVVVKIIGKVLEFAAAILGRVLPPVIRFAGFLIGNVVPAVVAVIGTIVRIIAKVVEFGKAVVDRIKDVAKFVTGLKEKFNDAVDFVKGIPDKIVNALGSIASLLYNAGRDLINGFVNGIKSKAAEVANAAKDVAAGAVNGVKGFLGINSPSRVFMDIGDFTMQGFRKGVEDGAGGPIKAAGDVASGVKEKVLGGLADMRDRVRSVLNGLKSDFAGLRDGIASSFTGDPFQAANAQDFIAGLLGTESNLLDLKAAASKLTNKFKLDPAFVSQLFSSGNGALALSLAGGSRGQAREAVNVFDSVGLLSNQLGTQVAGNQLGGKIDGVNARLDKLTRAVERQGKEFGRELNKSTSDGQRGRAA